MKDFQSWDNPVKDFLEPEIDKQASMGPIGGFIRGAFIGSLFGNPKSLYGKMVGTAIGGTIGFGAGLNAALHSNGDRKWRPQRRKDQEELNEYYDALKYVKNIGLYEKYRQKALREDHYDIEDIVNAKDIQGVENKNRAAELNDFKKTVKLNWKHRDEYPFKYGLPKYVDLKNMSQAEVITGINAELKEIQNDRSIDTVPENAVRAIYYKQLADKTMYGYEEGDPLQNLLAALPKKERQYFKYLADAPRKERKKILQIAPSYLRRALQQQYGMEVDKKEPLTEYFKTHGLPDASWAGWDEDTDIEDVKVKLVHQEKFDRGEFDIWDDDIKKANASNIPIPQMHARNNIGAVQMKLRKILTQQGYNDVIVTPWYSGGRNKFDIYESQEDKIARAIEDMDVQ